MNPCKPKDRVRITCGFMEDYPPELAHLTHDGKHHGVDLAPKPEYRRETSYIVAPVGGRVIRVDKYRGNKVEQPYGNLIVIESSESDRPNHHYLAHLYKTFVAVNQIVKKGILLGVMGDTGSAVGRHLHYEVRNSEGKPQDPTKYLT